jgi:hypothetical protein
MDMLEVFDELDVSSIKNKPDLPDIIDTIRERSSGISQ